ncbi:MAG: hypothetical protein U0528_09235 [Anaerolineae bacterium]
MMRSKTWLLLRRPADRLLKGGTVIAVRHHRRYFVGHQDQPMGKHPPAASPAS